MVDKLYVTTSPSDEISILITSLPKILIPVTVFDTRFLRINSGYSHKPIFAGTFTPALLIALSKLFLRPVFTEFSKTLPNRESLLAIIEKLYL